MIQNNTKSLCRILTICAAFALSACGGLPEPSSSTAPQASQPPSGSASRIVLGDDEVLSRLGALSAQQLATGECGLFLWAKRDDAPLVFFQRSGGQAYMHVDGAFTQLDRIGVEDVIGLQFHKNQQFTTADMNIRVTVVPENTQSLQQGLKLPTGSISVSTGDGWSASIPVAGAIGCK